MTHTRAFWIILFVALSLRVTAAVVIDQKVKAEGRQFLIEGDAIGYWDLAGDIATGEEYSIYTPPRRVLRTPGFPLLLAACRLVVGDSIFAASLVMAVIGTSCCWLTWRLARCMFDDATALIAMAITAVSPIQIGSCVQILSETWFTFWLLLCLFPLHRLIARRPSINLEGAFSREGEAPAEPARDAARQSRRAGSPPGTAGSNDIVRAFIAGILTGLTTLVRPGWILWTGLSCLLVIAFADRSRLRQIACCIAIVAGCFIALLPWATRNYFATGHWVFTSLWSGPSLYDGLSPTATGASDMRFFDVENVMATMSEFQMNAHYKQRAWDFVRGNPGRALELAFLKASRYLSPTLNAAGFSGGPFSLVCLVWYAVFVGLIASGFWSLRDRPGELLMLAGPFLQFLLVHMVFVGSIRYRLPVEFPLSIVAAHGFRSIVARGLQRHGASRRPNVS